VARHGDTSFSVILNCAALDAQESPVRGDH
jgi:hypothetical protein